MSDEMNTAKKIVILSDPKDAVKIFKSLLECYNEMIARETEEENKILAKSINNDIIILNV